SSVSFLRDGDGCVVGRNRLSATAPNGRSSPEFILSSHADLHRDGGPVPMGNLIPHPVSGRPLPHPHHSVSGDQSRPGNSQRRRFKLEFCVWQGTLCRLAGLEMTLIEGIFVQ